MGSFTTVATTINPNLAPSVYPVTWTEVLYTVTGLPVETNCKLAFRYYITNGGPTGANGNAIWIDALTINRTSLTTTSFLNSNFSIWPNPATNEINIANKSNATIHTIQISDINGRVIREANGSVDQISIADFNSGVYFIKITTDQGTGTTKIIKE
ncbi:MAG: T9SS type A sorting domain-containing protein [Flavobacterium sp.]|nr:T9SS type A sorting domain-containing protein [Flavobacterium sp.]